MNSRVEDGFANLDSRQRWDGPPFATGRFSALGSNCGFLSSPVALSLHLLNVVRD